MWYHGTRRENVKSILKKGLLKSGNEPDRDWCIYVSNQIEIARIYGDVILEIDTDKNDKITMIENGNGEFLIWNNINPNRIHLLHGGKMKVTVKYLTRERPNIDIQLRLIADGIWLLYCDFMERFECSGQLYDHPVNSILFEKDDKAIFSINIPYREDLIIFGSTGKKNYHALIMNYKKYCEIMEREDVNES